MPANRLRYAKNGIIPREVRKPGFFRR